RGHRSGPLRGADAVRGAAPGPPVRADRARGPRPALRALRPGVGDGDRLPAPPVGRVPGDDGVGVEEPRPPLVSARPAVVRGYKSDPGLDAAGAWTRIVAPHG